MVPLAFIVAQFMEFMEVKCLTGAAEGSKIFLESLKAISRKMKGNARIIEKYVNAWKPLQGKVGYPFYTFGKTGFLEFQDQAFGWIVNILVSN